MSDPTRSGVINSAEEYVTRRKMMATGAAMVAGGFAGCSGGGDGTDTSEDTAGGDGSDGNDGSNDDGGTSDGNDAQEYTISTWTPSIPTEMNFNTWASSYPWTPTWLLLEPVLRFYADGSVTLEMIDDWSYDGDSQTETVHFNDEFYWWNGDQVTAEDKYWYEQVAFHLAPESSSYEQLTLENNGQTIVREHKEPQNPQLVEYGLGGYLGAMLRGHRDKFRPWAEELMDATTDDERTNIEKRMAEEMPLNIETVRDEGLGTGPFQITDFDEQGIYCELFDQHPYADQIGIDRFEYVLASDEAVAQQIYGGDLDFGYGFLQKWVGEGNTPDHAETVSRYEDTFMRKLEFMGKGPAADHLRKRSVRRAIAHAIDLTFVSRNYSTESSPREAQTGLPAKVTQNWLGGYTDDFIDYPAAGDEDGATALMEAAGYERDGGSWLDGGGDQISMEIVVPSYLSNPARTITDQLSQFGFQVNMSALEGASYNDRTEDSVDFDMTISSHGSLLGHPYYYFRPVHPAGNDLGEANVIEKALEDGQTRSPYNGKELIVEIPTEPGQEDLSGSTEEVNLYGLYKEWQTAQTDERNTEIAKTFTRFWNFYLPGVDLVEQVGGSWGKTSDWEFEVDKEWRAYRGSYRGLKRGKISPK